SAGLGLVLHFFFVMNPPTPRSTLFPYTTLFRSLARKDAGLALFETIEAGRVGAGLGEHAICVIDAWRVGHELPRGGCISAVAARSEEHTSELQSLRHLVCRLLLEKKNQ